MIIGDDPEFILLDRTASYIGFLKSEKQWLCHNADLFYFT
jgi:hypothetical protein